MGWPAASASRVIIAGDSKDGRNESGMRFERIARDSEIGFFLIQGLGWIGGQQPPASRQATGRDAAVWGASAPLPIASRSRMGQPEQTGAIVSS
jgi:hypothetical protein